MNATNKWLDVVKAHHGLTSDYQLGKLLGISSSRIGNYRSKATRAMEDELAVVVAELAGVPPARVIAELHGEKAKTEAARSVWLRIAQMAAGIAIAATLFFSEMPVAQAFKGHDGTQRLNIMLSIMMHSKPNRLPR